MWNRFRKYILIHHFFCATIREDIVIVPLLFAFVRIATFDLGCSKNELNTDRNNGLQENNKHEIC